MSGKNVMRALAGTAVVLLATGSAGPGVAAVVTADSGDVQATVRKTVLQTGNAKGEIATSRMYTQVSAVGNGTKTVTVPVGVTSNRNLNEFGAFPMEGESIVFDVAVSDGGSIEERSLTDADINPMAVSVKVMLDGVEIAPEDVVGANGVLDVEYTVRNTTATTSPVTFTDVEGKDISEDIETAEPFVGSLDVVLPQGFNEVTAPGATIAGNGQNATQIGYTFVLFPPLGSPEVKVGYQSRISNGQMPAAEFSFLPIVPFDNSTIAGTVEAYRGGAETGASIFGAGTQIGDNLLKLQDGAGQLVSGLGQLSAGATQLSDGLVNTAAPGSAALADGANQVADGLNQLNANVPALEEGVSDLNAGAAKLNDGAETVADGNASLAAGIASLNGGLNLLSQGVAALPTSIQSNDGYKQLKAAIAGVQAAIGTYPDLVADPKTLGQALTKINLGLSNPKCDPADPTNAANPCGVKEVVAIVEGKLGDASKTDGAIDLLLRSGKAAYSQALVSTNPQVGLLPPGAPCPTNAATPPPVNPVLPPTALQAAPLSLSATDNCVLISNIVWGLGLPPKVNPSEPDGGLQAQTAAAAAALGKVVAGIGTSATADTILNGLAKVWGGLSNPKCDPKDPQSKTNPCGIKEIQGLVSGGIDQLVAGISQELLKNIGSSPAARGCDPTKSLTCASAALTAGSAALATGASQLADGTETLAAGTETLNSSVPTLASGVAQLDDGAGQVADGADQLAEGLGTAADGSGQLAEGLAQAEPGGAQIEAGAGQLKEEGADVLAETGKEAQIGFARNVALLEAAQQAGLEGTNMPFGNAEGTDVVTTAAYKMELAGIAQDSENTALKYGMAGLLLLAGGLAAVAGVRRLAR